MIKITHILKESFTTYLHNFKKIFWIALPILILSIISEHYIQLFMAKVDVGDYSNMTSLITNYVIYFICVLAVALYFGPVLNRAIQKKEDGENFNSNAAYGFQKKNIFKWIMVNVWGLLYMIWKMLPYAIVSGLLLFIMTFYKNAMVYNTALILAFVSLFVGFVLNINRFVLYKNIYFSKDHVKARDAVIESMKIGVSKSKQVWMLILTLIILTIAMLVIYFALSFVVITLSNMLPGMGKYIENIVTAVVSVLFFLPFMSIVTAKGYVKIRG